MLNLILINPNYREGTNFLSENFSIYLILHDLFCAPYFPARYPASDSAGPSHSYDIYSSHLSTCKFQNATWIAPNSGLKKLMFFFSTLYFEKIFTWLGLSPDPYRPGHWCLTKTRLTKNEFRLFYPQNVVNLNYFAYIFSRCDEI